MDKNISRFSKQNTHYVPLFPNVEGIDTLGVGDDRVFHPFQVKYGENIKPINLEGKSFDLWGNVGSREERRHQGRDVEANPDATV